MADTDTDLGEVVVFDVDATLVNAHREKENAAATFKRGFGYHPLGVWCDNTQEMLAVALRAGNAGSNTVTDHIEVLGAAITQVPAAHRRRLLIRAVCRRLSRLAGLATDQNKIRGRRVEYSVGFAVTENLRDAIALVPKLLWTPAINAAGEVRGGGDVVELTGLMNLTAWPRGMRVIVRRERPHPGAQLSLFEERDGGATKPSPPTPPPDSWRSSKPAAVPTHGSKTGSGVPKTPAWAGSPLGEFKINQAWTQLTAIATDLIAWLRLLALTGGAAGLAKCEPKTLRYRLLHVPARLTHGGGRRRLRIPVTWPWAKQIVAVFAKIAAIPSPG